jgi:hypothetical protein
MLDIFKKKPKTLEPEKPAKGIRPSPIPPPSLASNEDLKKWKEAVARARDAESMRTGRAVSTFDLISPSTAIERSKMVRHMVEKSSEENTNFKTIRAIVGDFERNVFSSISEGKLEVGIGVVSSYISDEIWFQLRLGDEEILIEEKMTISTNTATMQNDVNTAVATIIDRVLRTLTYAGMFKVIQKVDTL